MSKLTPFLDRISVVVHRLAVLAVILSVSPTVTAANGPARMVFFGTTKPVIIEAQFETGRFSIDQVRQRYSREIFKILDSNEDGQLDGSEASQIPVAGRLRAGVERLEDQWTELDIAPHDGAISETEFAAHIDSALGEVLSVERKPPRLTQTVRLYDDLDLNSNGKIDADEIEKGLGVLRAFDFDDDETLSVAELQPFPRSIVQAQQQSADESEPVRLALIRNDSELGAAVDLCFDIYREEGSVPIQRFPDLSALEFSRFDLNNDTAWDRDEVLLFLRRSSADYEMTISLSPPRIEIHKGKFEGDRRPTTSIGGIPVAWRASNIAYQQFDATRLYLIRFIMSDADKNGYLDPNEYFGLQAEAAFDEVDLDQNQQVTRDEIKLFFSLDGLAAQSRLILSLSNETTTLFDILDAYPKLQSDRRLSPREFLEGSQRMLEYDANGDGALLRGELQMQMQITFTQPQLFEIDPSRSMEMPQNQGTNIIPPTSGPVWFQRMDDNLDGELTWREFLGSRDKFDALDKNGDNFVDSEEAELAEALRTTDGSAP